MRLRSPRMFMYTLVTLTFMLLVYQNRIVNQGYGGVDEEAPPWVQGEGWMERDVGQLQPLALHNNAADTPHHPPPSQPLPITTAAISQKSNENKLIYPTHKTIKPVRILCFIKTQQSNFNTKAKAVKETWGRRCDKLIFISNQGNATMHALGIQPNVTEKRTTLTQKVLGAMKLMYEYYLDDFDWIQEADDDTYIVVDNLRYFLSDKDPKRAVYYGHRFKKFTSQGYTSGGAGYVMSNEALRLFGLHWSEHKQCQLKGAGSDANMGHCLNALGVKLEDSTDSLGRSRFHTFNLETHLFGLYPEWYFNYTGVDRSLLRPDFLSDYPISFHYSANRKMYILDYLFYRSRVWGKYDRIFPANETLTPRTTPH